MTDDTLEDELFRNLGAVHSELRHAFVRSVGTRPLRVQLFVRLRRDGEMPHSELGRVLGIDGASVTRLVKEVEADGFVVRRPDPSDNRYTLAALTPAGEEAADELIRLHRECQEQLLAGISSWEREVVSGVLGRIRENAMKVGVR